MRSLACLSLATALALLAVACKDSGPVVGATAEATGRAGTLDLQGAGATFPYPLYSKWIAEYGRLEPAVRINYQSIGSGGGIRQLLERTVDFGASDAPMTDAELAKAAGKVLHVPTTIGAVVVAYNLPGLAGQLQLTPAALSSIFLGETKTWDAPPIAQANPGVRLPATAITVIHRTDGSGTTAVFTDYLARVSAAWKGRVGAGKSVKFPAGLGAKGNEGVTGQVKTTPGSIGYVEQAYAKQTGLPYARVQNRAGAYVEPTAENIGAAAASAVVPDDLRVAIVDPPGQTAYPIASFTYVLLYAQQADAVKGRAVARFLWWAIHDGQRFGPPLHYAPLPRDIVTRVEAKLRALRAGGQPLLDKAS